VPGIANARGTGLGDESDIPRLECTEKLRGAPAHVMFVVANNSRVDAVLAE